MLANPNKKIADKICSEPTTLLEVEVQCALEEIDTEEPPGSDSLIAWAQSAYSKVSKQQRSVTIRLVDAPEMKALNQSYRGQNMTTNVLSFGYQMESESAPKTDVDLLGDIVICHSVLLREAQEQQKSIFDHYAHMVTHGILHLCGFDHEDDQSADRMEALEARILAQSGIANPYSTRYDSGI